MLGTTVFYTLLSLKVAIGTSLSHGSSLVPHLLCIQPQYTTSTVEKTNFENFCILKLIVSGNLEFMLVLPEQFHLALQALAFLPWNQF